MVPLIFFVELQSGSLLYKSLNIIWISFRIKIGFVNLFPPDLLSSRSQLARVIFHYKPSQFGVTSLSAGMVGWAGISHHERICLWHAQTCFFGERIIIRSIFADET